MRFWIRSATSVVPGGLGRVLPCLSHAVEPRVAASALIRVVTRSMRERIAGIRCVQTYVACSGLGDRPLAGGRAGVVGERGCRRRRAADPADTADAAAILPIRRAVVAIGAGLLSSSPGAVPDGTERGPRTFGPGGSRCSDRVRRGSAACTHGACPGIARRRPRRLPPCHRSATRRSSGVGRSPDGRTVTGLAPGRSAGRRAPARTGCDWRDGRRPGRPGGRPPRRRTGGRRSRCCTSVHRLLVSQYSRMAMGNAANSPPSSTPSGKIHGVSAHEPHGRLGRAGGRLHRCRRPLLAQGGPRGEVGRDGGQHHQRHRDHHDVDPVDVPPEGVEQVLRHADPGRQRRTEQPRLQERPDLRRTEHVVRDGGVLLEREPGAVEVAQHVQQREEHRHLDQGGDQRAERVHAVGPLQLLGLLGEPAAVVAVSLAQLRQLRATGRASPAPSASARGTA